MEPQVYYSCALYHDQNYLNTFYPWFWINTWIRKKGIIYLALLAYAEGLWGAVCETDIIIN